MADGARPAGRKPAPRLGRHLVALAALTLAIAILWAALTFMPGVSDRIAALPGTARKAQSRSGALSYAIVIGGALLIALMARQRIALGGRPRRLIAAAFPAGALGVATALAMSWAAGTATIAARPALDGGIAALLAGWLLIGWAALGEEVMFRGVLQPILRRAWGTVAALGLSALAFAIVHYLGGWRDPLSLLNIFAASLWFGLLALRTGGILAPVLAHVGWNGVEALVFGASPNPGVGAYGSLLDVDLAGRAILGGSADGLNASVGTTLVLAALIVPLAAAARIGNGTRAPVGTGV